MNIEDLREVSRRFAKLCLEILCSFDWRRMRNRRWLAFDMRQQRGDARHLTANIGLKLCRDLVRAAQRHRLGYLEVLFQMQGAVILLQRDVVNIQIAPGATARTRSNGLSSTVAVGTVFTTTSAPSQPFLHLLGRLRGHLFRALKTQRTRQPEL